MKIVIQDVCGPGAYELCRFLGDDELNPTYLSLHRSGQLKCVSYMACFERIEMTLLDEKWWPIPLMSNADANTLMRLVRPLLFDYFSASEARRARIDAQVLEIAQPFSAIDQGVTFMSELDPMGGTATFYDALGNKVDRHDKCAVECVIYSSSRSIYGGTTHQITRLTPESELAAIAAMLQWDPEVGYIDGLLDDLTEIYLTLCGEYHVHP